MTRRVLAPMFASIAVAMLAARVAEDEINNPPTPIRAVSRGTWTVPWPPPRRPNASAQERVDAARDKQARKAAKRLENERRRLAGMATRNGCADG